MAIRKIVISLLASLLLVACGTDTSVPEPAQASSTNENVEAETANNENDSLKEKLKSDYEVDEPLSFVRGDKTGKWRISKTAGGHPVTEYAVDFANAYMTDGDIVFIVDFTLKTTTMLRRMGNVLDVKTTEYVDKEEHDATVIGGGLVLLQESYDLETGEKFSTEADSSAGTVTSEELISKVKEAIEGQVDEGEKITDVTFDGSNLTVYVDMSGADTSKISARDISLSRISSITDHILSLDDSYMNTWNTVTVDFGSVGKAVLDKSMIQNGGLGKYFEFADSILN